MYRAYDSMLRSRAQQAASRIAAKKSLAKPMCITSHHDLKMMGTSRFSSKVLTAQPMSRKAEGATNTPSPRRPRATSVATSQTATRMKVSAEITSYRVL